MKTTIVLNGKEVITKSAYDAAAAVNYARAIELNPDWDPEQLKTSNNLPHPWNGYVASTSNQGSVDPIILDTHGVELFPDNQGTVEFVCVGKVLRGALEHYSICDGVTCEVLHVLKKGDGWDYARTMSNQSWKKTDPEWKDMFDDSDDYVWVTDKCQIKEDKLYHIEMIGGWGYVFIHEQ